MECYFNRHVVPKHTHTHTHACCHSAEFINSLEIPGFSRPHPSTNLSPVNGLMRTCWRSAVKLCKQRLIVIDCSWSVGFFLFSMSSCLCVNIIRRWLKTQAVTWNGGKSSCPRQECVFVSVCVFSVWGRGRRQTPPAADLIESRFKLGPDR